MKTPIVRRVARAALWLAPVLLAAGCGGEGAGGMLDAASPQAGRIAGLWWVLLVLGVLVYVLVMVALAVPLLRSRRNGADPEQDGDAGDDGDVQRRLVVGGGVALPVVVIVVLVVLGALVGREVAPTSTEDDLVIGVVGHQFWWEVTYPELGIVTANELHVPTGRPVRLELRSRDVIHSFWVPAVHGKVDLRPGAETALSFEVDRPGVHRGQCAEYCGLSHAQMGMLLVAQEPDDFDRWVQEQTQPAEDPTTASARRGQGLFEVSCASCHAVDGHTTGSLHAPDLTHLASRRTIAGAWLPNERDELRRWIRDPHVAKPGAPMPPADLTDDDLDALLDYLEGLE